MVTFAAQHAGHEAAPVTLTVAVCTQSSMSTFMSATKEFADMAHVTISQCTLFTLVWKVTLHLKRLQTWLVQQYCNEERAQTSTISTVYGVLKGNIQQKCTNCVAKLQ